MCRYPQIFRVRQAFDAPRLDDVPAEVHAQLANLRLAEKVRPGQSVAITAGSRGIAGIDEILRTIVTHLSGLGARPFVVPAMGSHGGATAEGQRQVLRSLGIDEPSVGCPIRAGMETVVVGQTSDGLPLHFDRLAFQADHVLLCGRVKPHTLFAGDIESGLLKMMLIGLGNRKGAETCHRASQDFGFDRVVRGAVGLLLDKCPILAGLAIVENAYDQTALVEGLLPEQFETRERQLLVLARKWLPRLPFDRVDVLLIDRIGKDLSGAGFDPNVVGRKFHDHRPAEDESPKVKRIALRSLTPKSRGNAVGIGLAEFCRTQLLRDADPAATRLNALSSGHLSAAMTPLDFETDREMLDAALGTVGLTEPARAKLLWIDSTLKLAELECSAAYLDEVRHRDDLETLGGLREMPFDPTGNLPNVRSRPGSQ